MGAKSTAAAANGPSRSVACWRRAATSTVPPSASTSVGMIGSLPIRRSFLCSSGLAGLADASVTQARFSRHAAGKPRNANTSCTHTPCPGDQRFFPARRTRAAMLPGRLRRARFREISETMPTAHSHSGTPIAAQDCPDHRLHPPSRTAPLTPNAPTASRRELERLKHSSRPRTARPLRRRAGPPHSNPPRATRRDPP